MNSDLGGGSVVTFCDNRYLVGEGVESVWCVEVLRHLFPPENK